ncbi:Intersectin-1 [Arthrobotrys entomopaga]|nr:Intersectin-1 [Arthrobotrys entomopaga]
MVDFQSAMAARALRNIKSDLEFLSDTGHITSAQMSAILSNLPLSDLGPLPSAVSNTPISHNRNQSQTPVTNNSTPVVAPVTSNASSTSFNEKTNPATPAYTPAPPAYSHPPKLSVVTALYPYTAADAGDLALNTGDTINVTEYVNADWWRGVNPATGQTGIFPKNYVKTAATSSSEKDGYGYGNVPLQVANSGSGQTDPNEPQQPSKLEAGGKKFGKKLGNAAIFGAGATIGSSIVGAIL